NPLERLVAPQAEVTESPRSTRSLDSRAPVAQPCAVGADRSGRQSNLHPLATFDIFELDIAAGLWLQLLRTQKLNDAADQPRPRQRLERPLVAAGVQHVGDENSQS